MRSKVAQRLREETPAHVKEFVGLWGEIITRIHDIMAEKGYTQKSLAEALDKSPSEVNKWLKGDHNLTLRSIAKMQSELGEKIIVVPKSEAKVKYINASRKQFHGKVVYRNPKHYPELETIGVSEFKVLEPQSNYGKAKAGVA